jgi:hypothetical protein
VKRPETVVATIKRAIQKLDHGPYADPLDCFCGSDILDRDEVLRAIDDVQADLRKRRRKDLEAR